MFNKKLLFIFIFSTQLFAQSKLEQFLIPSDSLNPKRLKTVIISETLVSTATLVGLSSLWYKNYPQSGFHFINDNQEWLQMDKAGHTFSSYQLGKLGAETLKWSGVSKKKQLIYGATVGFAFLTVVEVFDGYSSQWGASVGDVLANTTGTGLYVTQALLWDEQRIIPKFSFHTTHYASLRPNTLGSTFTEQILKDYNGQTYWLSVNLNSFLESKITPHWLNLAVGYGAEGMISGNGSDISQNLLINEARSRQFYLSFDADLTKIKTKSSVLKTFFSIFNAIKIPAPTLELGAGKGLKFHYLYF